MRTLPIWCIFFSAAPLLAGPDCKVPPSLFISTKHIEGRGVGYNMGYSSIEAFWAPSYAIRGSFLPLLDARMHIFNNADPAVNAGIGLRYLSSRVWGMNAFYDFRETKKRNYNQISLGFESLGNVWDFRINGYLPISKKTSALYDTKFHNFYENSLILSSRQQFAFASAQAEVATHALKVRGSPSYIAAGPYYLSGHGQTTWGGRARFGFDFFTYMRAEVIGSYDGIFDGILQGLVRFTIPLGPQKSKPLRWSNSCSKEARIAKLAHQRIDRNEIIPTHSKYVYTKAINPQTKQPYVARFVDNTQHGNGTFSSPYGTLAAAEMASGPNDIIYVFPGNGTVEGLETGFVMQQGQRLYGSNIDYTLPALLNQTIISMHIDKKSDSSPTITLSSAPSTPRGIVALADDCEVVGFHIISVSDLSGAKIAAIAGGPSSASISQELGVKNPFIYHNTIEGVYHEAAIFLHNSINNVTVNLNTLSDISASYGVECLQDVSPSSKNTQITKNTFTTISGGAIFVENAPGMYIQDQTIRIAHNQIAHAGADGISISNEGSSLASTVQKQTVEIVSNTISHALDNGIFVLNTDRVNIVWQNIQIASNSIDNCVTGRGVFVDNNGEQIYVTSQSSVIENNTVSSVGLQGILFLNYNDVVIEQQSTQISHNLVQNSSTGGIAFSNYLNVPSVNQTVQMSYNMVDSVNESGIAFQTYGPNTGHSPCIEIHSNQIQAASSNSIFIEAFSDGVANISIDGNVVTETVSNRSFVVNTNSTSSVCVDITNNAFDKDMVFIPLEKSEIFASPLENNQYETIEGLYTPVPAGTCDCQIQEN